MMKKSSESFILASSSPRRYQLLKDAGYAFEVVSSNIQENAYPADGLGGAKYASVLAKAKAFDVALKYPDRLVLGADCIVEQNGDIIGKPADESDAKAILERLFSKPHQVISAIAFICIVDGTELIDTDSTTVYPRAVTDENIREYVKTGEWEGKAGAYGIQDPETDRFIEKIDGSYSNVMGLPMEKTVRYLDRLLNIRKYQ